MLFMKMDQNKSGSLSDEDPAIVPCKGRKMTVISLSQLMHQVHLDLDLGLDLEMATVGLGKDHEKENLSPDQGE